MSPEIDKLVGALGKAQSAFPAIGFNATNPHFRNRYTTLAHLIAETRPALAANSLAVSQLVDLNDDNGACCVVTRLMHGSGQWLQSRTPVLTDKPGPQPLGAGITYARRYGLAAILGVASEEDDDGESAQDRSKEPRSAAGKKFRDAREAHEAGVPQQRTAPAARNVEASVAKADKEAGAISQKQIKLLWYRAAEKAKEYAEGGVGREAVVRAVLLSLGVEHTGDLPAASFDAALAAVLAWEPGRTPAVAADAAAEAF